MVTKHKFLYSVCTLVSNMEEYQMMIASYQKAGFEDRLCEFLFVDNSNGNQYDAYQGLNHLISKASGEYIILSHQDIELIFDDEKVLRKRIEEINQLDPAWAVLSNAGAAHIKKLYKRISHPHETLNQGPFPARVKSVDENFILLKRAADLQFSKDLKGFHLYGTDICLTAEEKGYSSYVIDFHLLHKSTGRMDESFFEARKAFIKKYSSGVLKSGYVRTTCTIMFLSNNSILSYIMNKPLTISLAKFLKKAEMFFHK